MDSREQIDLERGLLVTDGTGVVVSCTVSRPVQLFGLVTVTAYIPDWPVLNV